jgi:hypothetical protein
MLESSDIGEYEVYLGAAVLSDVKAASAPNRRVFFGNERRNVTN